MIVKVQLPLATNDTTPHALVYNEDRSVLAQVPVSRALEKLMKRRAKAYFSARIVETQLVVDHEVEEPSW